MSESGNEPESNRVTIHEAKTHLSRLLRRVQAGEVFTIARGDEPVARLVPIESKSSRQLGEDRGLYAVPEDFNAPLPDGVLDGFED